MRKYEATSWEPLPTDTRRWSLSPRHQIRERRESYWQAPRQSAKPATARRGRREMSQMRDGTPSNRSGATLPRRKPRKPRSNGRRNVFVALGGRRARPARVAEDLLVSSLGQHWGGIVIAVGQDEYDAIDAADPVTPRIDHQRAAGLWRRSVSQSVRQSVSPSAADRVLPGWLSLVCLCSFLAFGSTRSIPSTRELRVHRQRGGRKPNNAASWPNCQN